MASILKVDKLDPQSGTALEIGTSGDTVSIPSGATLDISASTLTPPATMPASSGINLTALNATNLGSGTVPTARLGSGTASSSTVLYGDQTYKAEPGGAYTLLGTYDITDNDADIEVKDKMDSTYKMYYVIGNMFKNNTDGTYLTIRASTNNGASYSSATDYDAQMIGQIGGSTSHVLFNNTGATWGTMAGVGYSGNNTDEGYNWDMRIYNSQKITGGYTYFFVTGTGQDNSYVNCVSAGSVIFRSGTAVNAFQLQPDSGTLDQGRLTIYGIS